MSQKAEKQKKEDAAGRKVDLLVTKIRDKKDKGHCEDKLTPEGNVTYTNIQV